MALVGYSDSESEEETTTKAREKPKPATTGKAGFQRFTDSANPHKIKVNLPNPSDRVEEAKEDGEPAPKRAKMSGGFNVMLPAPKRSKPSLADSARGKSLGRGISLKTGATPGFSRDVPEPVDYPVEDTTEGALVDGEKPQAGDTSEPQVAETQSLDPPKLTENAMRFKPLSVSRKPKKKSAAALMPALPSNSSSIPKEPPPKPKVSLFSAPSTEDFTSDLPTGEYKPLIYKNNNSEAENNIDTAEIPAEPLHSSNYHTQPHQSHAQPQSLSTIADSLNLSASQRRQLLGRKGANLSDANVVEFNTEIEYAANEERRAKGETATFNPVRSLTGGKHSLQQLVNLVSNQKDAYEESFATGKRNKKEAGAKYGW